MDADDVPLIGGDLVLLAVIIWAIFARSTWKGRVLGFYVRRAIMRERERLARELHDVIAHHLTIMVAGASAAKRGTTVDEATLALGTVETVGRDALVEMRRLLGRMHIEQHETGPPGLDQLPSLVARVEQAGLPVQLTVHGDRRRLPDGVDANAYRIIQEALTNTLKHAGPTQAAVVVGYQPQALRLWIYDFGVGSVAGSVGYGLDGMRQRVAWLGGQIAMGPRPGGGFEVAVALPVSGRR